MLDLATSAVSAAEAKRLAVIRRYDILDSPPDGSFDRITDIAARLFNVPISIITIVDQDRIWFKSRHGLLLDQIDRDEGLCDTTIMSAYPRILTDAKEDTLALTNPLVAGDFGLRFYAGVPLRTYDGYNLGTLCLIDTNPRPFTQAEIDTLMDLASVVMDQLELRVSARRAIAREKLLGQEIDHRMMNSLQFVSNLLTMQSRAQPSAEAKTELQMAANRVIAIGQVHRNFYAAASTSMSGLEFLRRLGADLAGILGTPIEVSGDDDLVPADLIQPIGLIASELVTNAAKYGAGRITLSYRGAGAMRELQVSNDGPALPANFNPAQSKGLGMRVIVSLTEQLHGQLTTSPAPGGDGARFTVTFPVPMA